MIRNRRSERAPAIEICQVVASYQIKGLPELDVLDSRGRLFEGVSLLSIGGAAVDLLTVPQKGADVLIYHDSTGGAYVLGVLGDQTRFVDSAEIDSAGEYSRSSVALEDAAILAGDARLIACRSQDALYLSPRVRVYGLLEITDGSTPDQSAAIAEPLLDLLEEYQSTIEELRARVTSLQNSVSQLAAEVYPPLIAAASGPPPQEPRKSNLEQQLNEANQLPSQTTTATAPPNRGIITSEIVKLER